MTHEPRDHVVARALEHVRAADPQPGFWAELEQRLTVADVDRPAGSTVPGELAEIGPAPGTFSRAQRRDRLVAAAAVLVVVMATSVLLASQTEPGVTVINPASPSTAPIAPPTTMASPHGGAVAVLAFLDALGRGDVSAAANRLGPLSEAYLVATAGSTEGFLREAEEGLGSWTEARDRSVRVVEVRPGDVVVVLSGQLRVEGAIEDRVTAFPARYSPSSGVWFVEPWAFDRDKGGRLEWDEPRDGVMAVSAPAAGSLWVLNADGDTPREWPRELHVDQPTIVDVDVSCCSGKHTLVLALINDHTYTAVASTVVIGR